jgi:predicted anti-sigma-YlaC factor YlaD
MRCRTAQRQIELKLDHELKQSHAHALDLHLAQCPRCRAYQARAAQLQLILRNDPKTEFPSWLHHRIMDQAAAHNRKRILYKHSFRLQTIPALLAVIFSLSLGVMIGKTAYRKVNPLPENASEYYSQQAEQANSQELASFGESSLTEGIYY